jgi:hypothetical protein
MKKVVGSECIIISFAQFFFLTWEGRGTNLKLFAKSFVTLGFLSSCTFCSIFNFFSEKGVLPVLLVF